MAKVAFTIMLNDGISRATANLIQSDIVDAIQEQIDIMDPEKIVTIGAIQVTYEYTANGSKSG